MNPIDLNISATDTSSKILKYRYKHDAKVDVEMSSKKLLFGTSVRYNSNMINIDKVFEAFINGLSPYRAEHNYGYVVLDIRASYHVNNFSTFALICKNLLNEEYTLRPADIQAPRMLTLQYCLQF